MTSCLQVEPFNQRLEDIADLDEFQLLALIGTIQLRNKEVERRALSKDAPVFDPDKASEEEQRRAMESLGRMLGLSDEQIRLQWENRNDPSRLSVAPKSESQESGFPRPVPISRRRFDSPAPPKSRRSQFKKEG